MAQIGKASSKRGKPSYIMSIIGVTLVLFLLGIVGWLVINTSTLRDYFRENVEVQVELTDKILPKDSIAMMQNFGEKAYIKSHEFVTKEMAKRRFLKDGEKDFTEILGYNPLHPGVYFHLKEGYVQIDSLEKIKTEIRQGPYAGLITDVTYPKDLVANINEYFRNITLIILAIAVILSIVVIFLIDNTIRLAMFSNRFLIKTMQMVGATRLFITKPLAIRAIINGAISAGIAIFLVYILISAAENYVPWLQNVRSSSTLVWLFLLLIVLGISITLFSTWRSVTKYLRMKLDELY